MAFDFWITIASMYYGYSPEEFWAQMTRVVYVGQLDMITPYVQYLPTYWGWFLWGEDVHLYNGAFVEFEWAYYPQYVVDFIEENAPGSMYAYWYYSSGKVHVFAAFEKIQLYPSHIQWMCEGNPP
jgi:hypothetical protein